MMQAVNVATAAPAAATSTSISPMRQAVRELGVSLREDDLAGARQAYADIVRAAPEGSTWNKDSQFAQLGKALVQGDLQAAKSAFADAIKGRIPPPAGQDPVSKPVESTPGSVPSSTGGASGVRLNVVA